MISAEVPLVGRSDVFVFVNVFPVNSDSIDGGILLDSAGFTQIPTAWGTFVTPRARSSTLRLSCESATTKDIQFTWPVREKA